MLHTGGGERHVNNLLSTIHAPLISAPTLKTREEEVGSAIINIANQSIDHYRQEEKKAAMRKKKGLLSLNFRSI